MDCLQNGLHKVAVHIHFLGGIDAGLHDFIVAVHLKHGHAVLLLKLADFAANAHALAKQLNQFGIKLVNLTAQQYINYVKLCKALGGGWKDEDFEK